MANPTWPTTLPDRPLQNGYSETYANNVLRTNMSTGPAKQRRRVSTDTRTFNMVLLLDESQMDDFDTFFDTTLAGGATPFDWEHPRTGVSTTFRFIGGKPPKISPAGGLYYTVSAELERLP